MSEKKRSFANSTPIIETATKTSSKLSKPGNNSSTTIATKFRGGAAALETSLKTYETTSKVLNDMVETECKKELDALKRAEEAFQAKLQAVSTSAAFREKEEELHNSSDEMATQFRKVERDIQKSFDDIMHDPKLDAASKRNHVAELTGSIESHYRGMAAKYPAATRAHMLGRLASVAQLSLR